MSEYQKLLSCWHKLEHYSPAAVPKGDHIKKLDTNLPWNISIKPSKGKTFEYTVYLGVFNLNNVIDFVKDFFKDETEEINQRGGNICIASLKVDINGKYVPNSLGISTLTWALAQLENERIDQDDWASAFQRLQDDIIVDLEYELAGKMTLAVIENIQNKISRELGWSEKPQYDIVYKKEEKFIPKYKKNEDEKNNADLLNSFFISDLEMIIKEFSVNVSSKAFLGYIKGCLNNANTRIDLNKEVSKLKESLIPSNYPDGCWPSRFHLSLMQQYAVNTIFNELTGSREGDILSVNGPPGTGKTTLLRDLVAAIVVKRAKLLAKIESPQDVFEQIGELETESGYTPWIWALDEKLCQSGIVVASSNNGAVENVSKELPLKQEVKPYDEDIGYFKNVAESCLDENYWGLISAVLGNKENRNNLVTSLWFNKDENVLDLRRLLNENVKDEEDWELVVIEFNNKLKAVQKEKANLNSNRENYNKLIDYTSKYNHEFDNFLKVQESFEETKNQKASAENSLTESKNIKDKLLDEIIKVKQTKPNFFTYIFNNSIRKAYKKTYQTVLIVYNDANDESIEKQNIFDKIKKEYKRIEHELEEKSQNLNKLNEQLLYYQKLVDEAKERLKENFADNEYWNDLDDYNTQVGCPWYSKELKKLQSELFISALKLNETFVLVANSKSQLINSTLSAHFNYLKGNSKLSNDLVKAMWDVFFLVIPVISTTFASVHTMFKDLGKKDLPWLFIDEAGQAVPQAAAGAIWRSKRVVVVGDPLQIEPVVTIPDTITNNFRSYFDLSDKIINSELSVQVMADRMNPQGMYLKNNGSDIWVGIPLRVHRRCLNPMFDIANKIAYNNKMVKATKEPEEVRISFETEFINQTGIVEGRHWVKEHGQQVLEKLLVEINYSKNLPDVFVITPFTEIAFKLRGFIYGSLLNEVRKYIRIKSEDMWDWLNTHIGTIHTFQGKQAEAVILCLGLDAKKKGAAYWASNKPNLLNVALTRAKYRFIAIGDEKIWLNVPYFKELKRLKLKD